jgi:hypothetical protein
MEAAEKALRLHINQSVDRIMHDLKECGTSWSMMSIRAACACCDSITLNIEIFRTSRTFHASYLRSARRRRDPGTLLLKQHLLP